MHQIKNKYSQKHQHILFYLSFFYIPQVLKIKAESSVT